MLKEQRLDRFPVLLTALWSSQLTALRSSRLIVQWSSQLTVQIVRHAGVIWELYNNSGLPDWQSNGLTTAPLLPEYTEVLWSSDICQTVSQWDQGSNPTTNPFCNLGCLIHPILQEPPKAVDSFYPQPIGRGEKYPTFKCITCHWHTLEKDNCEKVDNAVATYPWLTQTRVMRRRWLWE